MKKKVKQEKVEVPLYGFYETNSVKEANQLILSGEWFVKDVWQGKYFMKKIR